MPKRRHIVTAVGLIGLLAVVGISPSNAHRGFTVESLKGRWGFNEEGYFGTTPGYAAGIYRFDGNGNCTEVWAEAGGASSPQPTDFQEEPIPCEYTIDRHGRGTISGSAEIRFVVTQHGNLIRYVVCCARNYAGRGEMNRM